MRDRLPLLALTLTAVLGTLAVLLLRASRRGEFAEAFSTYRSEPDGARALFLLARQSGLPVARRHVDLQAIEGTPELVLLGVEGDAPAQADDLTAAGGLAAPDGGDAAGGDRWDEGRLDRYESKAILEAVNRGATLVYGVTRNHPLLGDLGLRFTPAEDHLSRTLTPFSPTALTAGVTALQSRVSGYLSVEGARTTDGGCPAPGASALPVLIDRHHGDAAVAVLLHRGAGRVLVMAAPTMASNAELAQGDAARFWLNVLGDLRPPGSGIDVDEYHHGFSSDRSVMRYASRYGLQWAIAQGLLALLVWSLALRRFGAARPLREAERRGGADYLMAMARIYRKGGHRQHAAQVLVRGATSSLGRAVQPALTHELAAVASRARDPLDEPALLALARRVARLRAQAAGVDPSSPPPGDPSP